MELMDSVKTCQRNIIYILSATCITQRCYKPLCYIFRKTRRKRHRYNLSRFWEICVDDKKNNNNIIIMLIISLL